MLHDGDDHVRTDVHDGVGVITLNKPAVLNAMNPEMRLNLMAAIDGLDKNPSVRAIIVTGAGRGFCAGADLSRGTASYTAPTEEGVPYRDGGGDLVRSILACVKPVIGAINGAAIGMGAAMTLAMDWRVASVSARFGFVYTQRGISPEGLSSLLLPRVVGLPTALDWMLTGRLVSATDALKAGYLESVVEPESLMPRAFELAHAIRDHTSAVSVAVVRQLLWGQQEIEATHHRESRLIRVLTDGPDAAEGMHAFAERRKPKFTAEPGAQLPEGWERW